MSTLRIPARYAGPPGSANGGVAAGMLAVASGLPGAVRVTLRRPPPLDTDLQVDGGRLLHGDLLVAEAEPGTADGEPPPAVTVEQAAAAAGLYAGLLDHPFPGCFVCGTEHEDGMGVRPGTVGPGQVAAVWRPVDDDPVMVWAALDCPGGWASELPGRRLVLGRATLRLDALPEPGEPHVVQGWQSGTDGKRVLAGTSLRTADGRLLAQCAQVWFPAPG